MQLDVSVVHAAKGEGVEAAVVQQNICAHATAGRPDNGRQNVLSGLLATSQAPFVSPGEDARCKKRSNVTQSRGENVIQGPLC